MPGILGIDVQRELTGKRSDEGRGDLLRLLYEGWQQGNTLQKASILPGIGDAAGLLGDIQMMYENPEERTIMNGLLAAAGLLPFVPAGLGATVFHGSPHRFTKVDLDKVGTGEGAQMYGHGFYSADAPEVAKSYAPRDYDMEEEFLRRYNQAESAQDYEMAELYEAAMLHQTPDEIIDLYSVANGYEPSMVKKAELVAEEIRGMESTSNLYELDLPDETIDQMLKWEDAPYEGSREAGILMEIGEDYGFADDMADALGLSDMYRGESSTGGELYGLLSSSLGGDAEASAILHEYGIPGITYWDQISRAGREGTRNYVNFNADDIRIMARNGVPITGLLD
jgi:hypothetical protein